MIGDIRLIYMDCLTPAEVRDIFNKMLTQMCEFNELLNNQSIRIIISNLFIMAQVDQYMWSRRQVRSHSGTSWLADASTVKFFFLLSMNVPIYVLKKLCKIEGKKYVPGNRLQTHDDL